MVPRFVADEARGLAWPRKKFDQGFPALDKTTDNAELARP